MTPHEQRGIEIEVAKLDYEHFKADALGRFNSVDEFARGALRGLTIGNGGAIVALFTFIGNDGAVGHYNAGRLWWAFAFFVAGLVFVFAATICGYFSQAYYMQASNEQAFAAQATIWDTGQKFDHLPTFNRGEKFEVGGIVGACLSLVLFAVGSGFALAGVLR